MPFFALFFAFIFGLIGFLAVYCALTNKWPDENDFKTIRTADYFAIVVITALIVVLSYAFFFS